ncbi:hypothetical protein ACIQOV_08315 [Kitasatospora sp. NPDC091257]|uniref:hypothetical protein n=1 Tax=Kitasatospora sp. NPDC091257 TaxID=3364084 RepID=UPI00383028EF
MENGTDHRVKASVLAKKASLRTGADLLTDAAGEGLAAVAHALLGSLPNRMGSQVWLEVRAGWPTGQSMLVRGDRITAVQVREWDGQFLLEVFVEGHGPGGQWLAAATGAGEWFELNAGEALLTLLAEIVRDEQENLPAVFLRVEGRVDDKHELLIDRN